MAKSMRKLKPRKRKWIKYTLPNGVTVYLKIEPGRPEPTLGIHGL